MRPATSVPVTTSPAPDSVNARSTARRGCPSVSRGFGPSKRSASSQRGDAVAGDGRHRHDRGVAQAGRHQQRAHLGGDQRNVVAGDIGLGQRDDASVDAKQIEDRGVFAGLRHDTVIERHHQQRRIDSGGAGQHGVYETLVARHIDEAERPSRRVGIGEAEIDRDAATLFLREPIGVDAGERLHQRGLAVVDMTRGADDHGRPSRGTGGLPTVLHARSDTAPGRTPASGYNAGSVAARKRRATGRTNEGHSPARLRSSDCSP